MTLHILYFSTVHQRSSSFTIKGIIEPILESLANWYSYSNQSIVQIKRRQFISRSNGKHSITYYSGLTSFIKYSLYLPEVNIAGGQRGFLKEIF